MWRIKIKSKNFLSEETKEVLINYASSEGDKIILHDALETKNSLELIFETTKEYAENLLLILKNDFRLKISLLKLY
jgi:hypothetical protein